MPFAATTTAAVARVIRSNNARIARVDTVTANPRPVDGLAWHAGLAARTAEIRAEWATFDGNDGQLPAIEAVLGEHQGNEGSWQMGLLVHRGRATALGREHFGGTLTALEGVPGLAAALWSVLAPATELTAHEGPNAGVLRYHLGIDCPDGAALRVGERVVAYRDGEGILFDDTARHAAWNHADRPRVTLFCEIERPLPPTAAAANRVVQRLLQIDARNRGFVARADEWHRALNP